MGKIKQLDNGLSNKIAAGEVVERPASVVKELVENAIDANSTRIEVITEEAGLTKIQVIDNGDGLLEEDCLIAFERHATSKIKDEHDLFRIRTLGFRGEALPSIASVSEVELKTATGTGPGTLVVIKGGEFVKKEPANSRKGTDITVKHIFFNTPARLKHLKTIHTELGNISDTINRMALAHPRVSFRLVHNGKELLHTNGNGEVLQVIAAIYGMSIAQKMLPLSLKSIDFEITGYVGLPEVTRASRNYISTMINGRFIKNYPLTKAILTGYHTLLPIGRFPICLLDIQMDPLLVDVNVHPAKLEVRLSKESNLVQLVDEGIKHTFRKTQLIPEVAVKQKFEKRKEEQQTFTYDHVTSHLVEEDRPVYDPETIMEEETLANPKPIPAAKELPQTEPIMEQAEQVGERHVSVALKEAEVDERHVSVALQEAEIEENVDRIPPFYPIGQMHGTYILAQNETGLFLIDQHAAQERVKYEYYREKVGEVDQELQELLIPMSFEFTQKECHLIEESLDQLHKVGVFLENFGRQSYIVRSHPQWFPSGHEREIIEDMIEQVITQKTVNLKQLREEAAIMMSCKKSIKANHHLRDDEVFALLESLRKSTDPFTCPHGRPIIIHFSTYEIEKMFKRIM